MRIRNEAKNGRAGERNTKWRRMKRKKRKERVNRKKEYELPEYEQSKGKENVGERDKK